ncbi:MAG: DUF1269 domain-containing protein [Chloroflexota bacterium]
MTTLTVWKFDDPMGAQDALNKLVELSKQHLIQINDAAVVSWEEGKKKPKTHNYGSTTGQGALSGAFWGMLFGLIFFVPFFGLAIGAAAGALTGKFADYGINDRFIKEVRDQVTEGTSALFLMTSGAVQDRVVEAFQGVSAELIQSNLTNEQEAQLMADFGE